MDSCPVKDLLRQIFSLLSLQDLLRLRRTCQKFQRVLSNSAFWKLKISSDFPRSTLKGNEMTQDTYYLTMIDGLRQKIRIAKKEKDNELQRILTLQNETFYNLQQLEIQINLGESNLLNKLTEARELHKKYANEFLISSDQDAIHELRAKAKLLRRKAISRSLIVIERKYFSAEVQFPGSFFKIKNLTDLKRQCQKLDILTNCSFNEGNLIGFYFPRSHIPNILIYLYLEDGYLGLHCVRSAGSGIHLPCTLEEELSEFSKEKIVDLYNQSLLPTEKKLQIGIYN